MRTSSGWEVTEDGEPGQDLAAADLTDADFRDADLSNAQLSTVTGLRAEMLAGAVLTNAKLPDDIKTFDQLKHVEETSRNATTVFFGLLAASLYSWLTIATTTDVALITGTASSPLPIINTNIALSGFYLAAPLILLAVYFYFHLYLQRLWSDLASLPAVFPDGVPLDRKAYPWLLNGLVRAHFKKLELAQRPLTRVENVVSILLAWWVVPFTLLAFWLRFLPRHDWLGTSLHVVLIAGAAWFGVHSYQLAVQTLRGERRQRRERGDRPLLVRMWRTIRRYRPGGMEAAGFGVAIVVMLSVGAAIEPGDDFLTALGSGLGYETYADLTDDDISTKPSGWTGRDETAAVEIAQVKGADLEGRDLRDADASGAFLVKAKLAGADLRGANLADADLRGADLSDADLRDANLSRADLREAPTSAAPERSSGADLGDADLSGADLRRERRPPRRQPQRRQPQRRQPQRRRPPRRQPQRRRPPRRQPQRRRPQRRRPPRTPTSAAPTSATPTSAAPTSAAPTSARRRSLRRALNLTQAQLDEACGDDKTQLPQGLTIRTCPVTAPPASPSPPTGSS